MIDVKRFSAILASCLMWYGLLAVTACTEQAENEVAQSDIPIYFSVSMSTLSERPVSRTTATTFEPHDKIGLFATLQQTTLDGQRYIDNLLLETSDGKNFIPEYVVYYPENNASLNFTAYHPYQPEAVASGNSILPVSVQTDQSVSENYTRSDFLWTRKEGVGNTSEAVQLVFTHQFSKLKIALAIDEEGGMPDLSDGGPRVIVTGIKTEANCNLENGSISGLQIPADITPYGIWTERGDTLVGKELILIPQTLGSQEQSIIVEWEGRIYTYLMPEVSMDAAEQCEVTINFSPEKEVSLTGIAGSITDWTDTQIDSGNSDLDSRAIYVSSLSFSSSGVYRVFYQGRAIAEICKEYLVSEQLTSRAIVHYPIDSRTGKADLKNGTVLQLLDAEGNIAGGKLCWETDGNGFTYQKGDVAMVHKFYVGEDGSLLDTESLNAADVSIVSRMLHDVRGKESIDYPVVKVGKQYWLQEDLRTACYQDGTALVKHTKLGEGAGYFHAEDTDIYFYNGEAVLAGKLAPKGWKIPSLEDWKELIDYVDGDVSSLKVGEWLPVNSKETEGLEAAPVTNLTGFSLRAQGSWSNGSHSLQGQITSYCCMDTGGLAISDETILFRGELNECSYVSSRYDLEGKVYYKALSLRCIED